MKLCILPTMYKEPYNITNCHRLAAKFVTFGCGTGVATPTGSKSLLDTSEATIFQTFE